MDIINRSPVISVRNLHLIHASCYPWQRYQLTIDGGNIIAVLNLKPWTVSQNDRRQEQFLNSLHPPETLLPRTLTEAKNARQLCNSRLFNFAKLSMVFGWATFYDATHWKPGCIVRQWWATFYSTPLNVGLCISYTCFVYPNFKPMNSSDEPLRGQTTQ